MPMPIHSSSVARVALAGIVSIGLLAAQPPVDQRGKEEAEFQALVGRLTPPLQPQLVGQAVRHPRTADGEAARRLVLHLQVHGGSAAVHGLLALATHSDPEVRLAVLRGVKTLGMRAASVVEVVRAAMDDLEPAVRRAAIEALGRVGEADDVAVLIQLLSNEEGVQAVAFRALRALTGARIGKDARSWTYWWSLAEKDLGKRVDAAIHQLGAGGTKAQVADARGLLVGAVWFARGKLEGVAREWLGSDDARLRGEALRLITGTRLADLSGDVDQALLFELEPEVVRAGRECAAVLGIRAGQPSAAPPGKSP